MKKFCLAAFVLLIITSFYASAQQSPQSQLYTSQAGFVENKGQSRVLPDHLFSWKHNNVFVYFMEDRVVFLTQEITHIDNAESLEAKLKGDDNRAKRLSARTSVSRFDLVFENASNGVQIAGEEQNSVCADFYYGHCPDGLLKVPAYKKVRYKNIWQGIDMVFSFDGVSMKYYFEVAPGASADQIGLRWDGVENVQLNANNELQFDRGAFTFFDKAPVSFCGNNTIETSYSLDGNHVRFVLDKYDATQPLIIDPGLYWASSLEYNGYGSWGELVTTTTGIFYIVDWEWNPGGTDLVNYMASATTFSNFSSDATNEDIVISKFSKDGALMWVCKYGGTGEDDVNGGVELDNNNNLYIAGTSAKEFSATSGDFPLMVLAGAFNQGWDGTLSTGRRGYLLKFSPTNTRLWATYLDRGANLEVFDISCNQTNSIFMTGISGGNPTYIPALMIPSGGGYQGALNGNTTSHSFILQFNSANAVAWGTWLPGVTASTSTGRCSDIVVNKANGYVYVAGDEMWSFSTPFNTALISAPYSNQGDNDMFFMAFDGSNQPIPAYGKYYGGAGFDKINVGAANGDIELDASGNLYLCGHTYSANFPPILNPGGCAYFDGTINDGTGITANEASTQDGFLYKVNTSGTVTYGTFFGGTAYTSMKKLKKDSHGNLWISGEQNSTGLAQSSRTGYFNQAFTGTNTNVLFAQLGINDNLEWLAYYGFATGYAGYNGFDIYEPTTDSVYINYTGNFNYTINTGGGYQYSATSSCTGAAQFRNYYTPFAPFTISGTTSLCAGGTTTWTASSAGGTWSSSNTGAATIDPSSGFLTAVANGSTTITYTLTVLGCPYTQTATVTVAAANVSASAASPSICSGSSTTVSASGATTYSWSPTGSGSSFTASPSSTTTYSVTGTSGSCTNSATVTVTVNATPTVTAAATQTSICSGAGTTISAGGAASYAWSPTGSGSSFSASPASTTTYSVTGTSSGCTNSASVTVTVNPVTDAAMNPAGPFCTSDAATTLTAVNAGGIWAGTGITNTSSGTFNPGVAGVGTHEITYTTTGTCPDTDTMNIVVSSVLDATITPAGPFCISGSAVTLTAATAGGTWSGTGITNASAGTFDPATAGVGTHEIIYTTSGACGDIDTAQISVVSQLDATITAAGPYCENDAAVVLSAANAGGTWSGTGITNAATGAFDPAVAGNGTYEIIYTIAGSCGDADSVDIVINDSPDFTYVATDESCTGALDGNIALTVTGGMNPLTYTWSTGANTASVAGIGEGSYTVTVTDANGCTRNAAITLGDPGVPCDDIIPHAVVPNAFSPNGDGENDVLYVRGEGVTQLSFIVYDRWGEKVFSTTTLNNGWDGTFRGKELDPAVFTYYLHAIFIDGSDKIEKGDVTLTR